MAQVSADTPLMRQYLSIKRQYAHALLFFRLGDFYELFLEDAIVASEALGITLTTRDKNKVDPVPMCGVPHHAAQGYVRKLIDQGFKVAICEQVEDPKTARGVVRREVTEVITPGVVLDAEQLDAKRNNFLAAIVGNTAGVGLAALDFSTFDLRITQVESEEALANELARIYPREVVHAPNLPCNVASLKQIVGGTWEEASAELRGAGGEDDRALIEQVGGGQLEADDAKAMACGIAAAALALRYVETTRPDRDLPTCRVQCYRPAHYLQIDEASLRNLDVLRSCAGERDRSLLGALDVTLTPMGGRLLRQFVVRPLIDVGVIRRRQDAVELLVDDHKLRRDLRDALRGIGDLERLNSRTVLGVATPRDLRRLGLSLERLPEVAALLDRSKQGVVPKTAPTLLFQGIDEMQDVSQMLLRALAEDPPAHSRDGGIFQKGFNAELDELVALTEGGRASIIAMEGRLREETGIGSLKIKYNKVFGYFIEITKANLRHVPEYFTRRQTLVNAERFVTEELADYEARVLSAQQRRSSLEQQLFDDLRNTVATHTARVTQVAERLALLDVLCSLAQVAETQDYTRPIVDESSMLDIEGGRHPVVERFMEHGTFVPNDVRLDVDGQRMAIITGPNMAGKSTVIRQTALITLMAQIGSFVPCRRCRVGVVDRIFTRVGASDDLARGQSTFMVEMCETSTIARNATAKSLVILDEIGRGTSTYDGISIAWAVAEHLCDSVKARVLFATHYHELCLLESVRSHVANYMVAVREWQGDVVFLHQLSPGSANRSYGIEVARLAGLPESVVARARLVLAALEGNQDVDDLPLGGRVHRTAAAQLDLLNRNERAESLPVPSPSPSPSPPRVASELEQALAAIEIDSLTPLEALNLLATLSRKAKTG